MTFSYCPFYKIKGGDMRVANKIRETMEKADLRRRKTLVVIKGGQHEIQTT